MLKKLGYRDYESTGGIDEIGLGRLAKAYSNTVARTKYVDSQRDEEVQISMPHLEVAKKRISEKRNADFDEVSGHLPVASVFDALQVVKARKDIKKNVGLRSLGAHLNEIWKKDRTANLTANTFLNLKDHYVRNYPKSGLSGVFDEISNNGYFTLPLSDLMQIAAQIKNQKDFNYMMVEHGLDGMHPHQVKARNFIVATLSGDSNEQWASSHETSIEIANAIFDISDDPERTWQDPTPDEYQQILEIAFDATGESELFWGDSTVMREGN